MLGRLLRPAPPRGPLLALHAGAVLATHVAAGALLGALAVAAAAGFLRASDGGHAPFPAAPNPATPDPASGDNVLDV